MFKSNGKKAEGSVSPQVSINLIGAGTRIQGDITADGDLRIDGQLKGTINTKAKLVVGPTGQIDGDLLAGNADISGSISGNVNVKETLFLKASARINGDIQTGRLVIEAGATFNGSCKMNGPIEHVPSGNGNGTRVTENQLRAEKAE